MTLARVKRFAALMMVGLTCLYLAGCGSSPADGSSSRSAERLYLEARDDMQAGSYERAINSLQRVEGLGAGSLLAQQAQLDLAYLYWRTAERAQALSTIDRFIRLNPSSPALDYAMYLKGVVNFNDNLGLLSSIARQDLSERDQRASRDSFQAFKQLVDQFPDSRYAPDARLRMQYIINALAAYEVHVARYYLRRGAYVAAVNRAQQAISEFQQSPSNEEALAIIAQAYDRLDLMQLRDDARRVLKQNYPQSPFLEREVGASAGRSWWKFW